MLNAILFIVTMIVAALRFAITPRLNLPTAEGSYEAFAHLFVGALFGGWFVSVAIDRSWVDRWNPLTFWLVLAVAISLLELVMFIVQKSFA